MVFLLKMNDDKNYHSVVVQSKAIIKNRITLIHGAVMSSAEAPPVMLRANKKQAPLPPTDR